MTRCHRSSMGRPLIRGGKIPSRLVHTGVFFVLIAWPFSTPPIISFFFVSSSFCSHRFLVRSAPCPLHAAVWVRFPSICTASPTLLSCVALPCLVAGQEGLLPAGGGGSQPHPGLLQAHPVRVVWRGDSWPSSCIIAGRSWAFANHDASTGGPTCWQPHDDMQSVIRNYFFVRWW